LEVLSIITPLTVLPDCEKAILYVVKQSIIKTLNLYNILKKESDEGFANNNDWWTYELS
jgi:hypothetical protein